MESNNNTKYINFLVKLYQKYIESNYILNEMISTSEVNKNWNENFHLIDRDWIIHWKSIIFFDELEKENIFGDYKTIYNFIVKKLFIKNYQNQKLKKLINKRIYSDFSNQKIINPYSKYDVISEEFWRLVDLKKENKDYDGKISLLKGNKKLIIKIDENNYSVIYMLYDSQNFGEFIIEFIYPDENFKKYILNIISKENIYNWMKEINFKNNGNILTINKYKIPFNIKKKPNINFIFPINSSLKMIKKNNNEESKVDSFSKCSYNFMFTHLNDNSENISLLNEFRDFFTDIGKFRCVKKIEKTSNICAVMRCLSMIEPLAEYFMSNIKAYKIFKKFKRSGLLNLVRDYFLNLWSREEKSFVPNEFMNYLKYKKVNIEKEDDPFNFLKIIIENINDRLNNSDLDLNINFNDLEENLNYSNLNSIIENNDSIIGKTFLGLILERYKCEDCKDIIIEKINKLQIEIDYISIINYLQNIGNSFIDVDINDFLKYYFLKKDIENMPRKQIECSKCGNIAKIIKREILKFPPYLIIRLKLGEFDEKKGFLNKLDMPDINFNKIESLKDYFSKKNKTYNSIDNYEYDLISMIYYLKKDEEIKFLSSCKSPFGPIGLNTWILFNCDSKPIEFNKENNKNFSSCPCLLFYKLTKKFN